jgi:peptidoglycan hydrolase-like protein with peptidoglycan-binding domain
MNCNKKYMGDFAENPALVPQGPVNPDHEKMMDANGNEVEAKVDNGTLIIKEKQEPKHVFKKMLKFGDRSDQIKDLQTKLNELGYYNDKLDGVFGFRTMIAVKSFQKSNAKEPTGKVDAETFNLIFNPSKEVQEGNLQKEKSASNKKKLAIAGVGLVGAYLLMKE